MMTAQAAVGRLLAISLHVPFFFFFPREWSPDSIPAVQSDVLQCGFLQSPPSPRHSSSDEAADNCGLTLRGPNLLPGGARKPTGDPSVTFSEAPTHSSGEMPELVQLLR